uniref:Uncharacterized protein n=1 Tax=Zosterops lateralis melanops TaxID=1220523 RepID=A0A8D2QMA0_ZOSLA
MEAYSDSASQLLIDFKEMYEYEARLKTFTKWPFQENCKCTPENVKILRRCLVTEANLTFGVLTRHDSKVAESMSSVWDKALNF